MLDALQRLAEDEATCRGKRGQIIGSGSETVLGLGRITRELLATAQDIDQLARSLLSGRYHAHARTHRMTDRTDEKREVRAAQHHGIDAAVT